MPCFPGLLELSNFTEENDKETAENSCNFSQQDDIQYHPSYDITSVSSEIVTVSAASATMNTAEENGPARLTIEDRDVLNHMRSCAEKKKILNVGGKYFHTSETTLKAVPNSLFSKMLHKDSPYLRAFEKKPTFYIDRDFKHFDIILNFLRNGGKINAGVLPRDLRQHYELRIETVFYQLPELTRIVDMRLVSLFDTPI